MTGSLPNKKTVLEQLLTEGMVLVALDARLPEVDVPTHLGQDPQLRLNLSYRFGLPMAVEPWGVRATLTFAGVPYSCCFPWRAVFLMVSHVSGQPYLFPDDIPAELLSQAPRLTSVGEAVQQLPTPSASGRAARPQPRLTLVSAARSPSTSADPSAEASGAATGAPPANSRKVHRILPGIASAKRRERRPEKGAVDGPSESPEAQAEARAEPTTSPKAERPVVPAAPPRAGQAPPPASETQQEPSPQQPHRRGHLRLVKP